MGTETLYDRTSFRHVKGEIHMLPSGLVRLQQRPWHHSYRTNVADHKMIRYRCGIHHNVPDTLATPLFWGMDAGKQVANGVAASARDAVQGEEDSAADQEAADMMKGSHSSKRVRGCF